MLKNELSEVTDFIQYVERLVEYAHKYLIIVAAGDTPCGSEKFTSDVAVKLMQSGFTIPLHNKWRCSYAAIVDAGTLVFEGISQNYPVRYEQNLRGTEVIAEGSCYGVTGGEKGCRIVVNGEKCVSETRGLAFAVYDKTAGDFLDVVTFDTFIQDIICHRKGDSPQCRAFQKKYPGVTFILPVYPDFPTINLSSNEKYIEKYKIDHFLIKARADTLKTPINKYVNGPDGVREVLSAPMAYIGTDGARRFFDITGKYVNVVNGHRITKKQPDQAKRTIYTVGACNTLGIGVRDCGTLASQLQSILNDKALQYGFIVENYGYNLEGTNAEKENIAILESLMLKPGDIVVGFGGVRTDCSGFSLRPHSFGELFYDKYHYTERCHGLVAQAVFNTLQKNDFFESTYEKNRESVTPVIENAPADYGLSPEQMEMLQDYRSTLSAFYEQQFGNAESEPVIGAIVMNCNPFTLGHRYLIEQSSRKVDFLVVFVVQEDKSFFPFEDRIDLVDKGTEDLPNIGVIESGSFIISTLTFSEYFNKSQMQDRVVDCTNDVTLFAREIAPSMHISVRFAGSEPFDRVTRQYNETLAGILPKYGIKFEEIPRLEKEGEAVSASRVRTLLEQRDWTAVEKLVSATTMSYLRDRFL